MKFYLRRQDLENAAAIASKIRSTTGWSAVVTRNTAGVCLVAFPAVKIQASDADWQTRLICSDLTGTASIAIIDTDAAITVEPELAHVPVMLDMNASDLRKALKAGGQKTHNNAVCLEYDLGTLRCVDSGVRIEFKIIDLTALVIPLYIKTWSTVDAAAFKSAVNGLVADGNFLNVAMIDLGQGKKPNEVCIKMRSALAWNRSTIQGAALGDIEDAAPKRRVVSINALAAMAQVIDKSNGGELEISHADPAVGAGNLFLLLRYANVTIIASYRKAVI